MNIAVAVFILIQVHRLHAQSSFEPIQISQGVKEMKRSQAKQLKDGVELENKKKPAMATVSFSSMVLNKDTEFSHTLPVHAL